MELTKVVVTKEVVTKEKVTKEEETKEVLFPKDIEGFGYKFNEKGELRNIKTGMLAKKKIHYY